MNEKDEKAALRDKSNPQIDIDNIEAVPLYQSQRVKLESKNEVKGTQKTIDEETLLYEKEIECPICFAKFQYLEIKANSYTVEKIDSDFLRYCTNINPLFYGVIICESCGYSALKQYYTSLTSVNRKLIKEKISSNWKKRTYPKKYDLDIAIERYKLSLLCAISKITKSGEIADICLRLCWLYRLKGDAEKETYYMNQAVYGFKEALEKETNSVVGIDSVSLTYLIGELSRRLGDFQTASTYFSQVLYDKAAKPSIKEKARVQKDLLKDAMEKLDDEATDNTASKADKGTSEKGGHNSGKKFFFF